MHSAGATNTGTTADFGTGQVELVSQYEQQWPTVAVIRDGVCFLIDD